MEIFNFSVINAIFITFHLCKFVMLTEKSYYAAGMLPSGTRNIQRRRDRVTSQWQAGKRLKAERQPEVSQSEEVIYTN